LSFQLFVLWNSLCGFTEKRERFWIYPRTGSHPEWLGIVLILLSLSSHILECCFPKVCLNTFGSFWILFKIRGFTTYTVEKTPLKIRKLSKYTNSRHSEVWNCTFTLPYLLIAYLIKHRDDFAFYFFLGVMWKSGISAFQNVLHYALGFSLVVPFLYFPRHFVHKNLKFLLSSDILLMSLSFFIAVVISLLEADNSRLLPHNGVFINLSHFRAVYCRRGYWCCFPSVP
jgi:hypothetical protein